jgi:hypothetical protein
MVSIVLGKERVERVERVYLSDFETIIDLVLEWTHHYFSDQGWVYDRLLHNEW